MHTILIILLNYIEGCSSNDNNVRIGNKRTSETENDVKETKMSKKEQEDSVVLQKIQQAVWGKYRLLLHFTGVNTKILL